MDSDREEVQPDLKMVVPAQNSGENLESGKSEDLPVARRDKRGRFTPGQSGNVLGGPRGQRLSSARLFKAKDSWRGPNNERFEPYILKIAIERAEAGRPSLLEKLLDKFYESQNRSKQEIEGELALTRPVVFMRDIRKGGVPLEYQIGSPDEPAKGAE